MANKGYDYQYETSPRKVEPEYEPVKKVKTKQQQQKKNTGTAKNKNLKKNKKTKNLFEIKFVIASMFVFGTIFGIIACDTLVEQKYKEKAKLQQDYDILLSKLDSTISENEDVRQIASDYGMQTKSATLINLEIPDYIETSTDTKEDVKEQNFIEKIIKWIKKIV